MFLHLGFINDGDDCEFDERDWSEYWRCIFNEITMEDIINYEKKYKGLFSTVIM